MAGNKPMPVLTAEMTGNQMVNVVFMVAVITYCTVFFYAVAQLVQ